MSGPRSAYDSNTCRECDYSPLIDHNGIEVVHNCKARLRARAEAAEGHATLEASLRKDAVLRCEMAIELHQEAERHKRELSASLAERFNQVCAAEARALVGIREADERAMAAEHEAAALVGRVNDAEARALAAEAALDLHLHIASCEQCSGPNDGCDEGQRLEGVCIDDLGIDPYSPRRAP